MREVLAMAGFTGAAALLLGSLNLLTAPRIEAAREAARFAHLVALTGTAGPFEVRAADAGLAVVHNTSAPDQHIVLVSANGYGGPIDLAAVLRADGTLVALATLRHQETPGLGDFIETRRSGWSRQFIGRRDLDGVDGRTGATITARAYMRAVQRALAHYRGNTDA